MDVGFRDPGAAPITVARRGRRDAQIVPVPGQAALVGALAEGWDFVTYVERLAGAAAGRGLRVIRRG